MKLNICIDIDGTITDSCFILERANKHFKKNITPQDVDRYEIYQVYNIPYDEFKDFYFSIAQELLYEVEPRENAKDALIELDQQHSLHYVTAREDFLEDVTKRWFEKHNLPKGELYILGSHYKVQTAKEVKCDIFIEDRYNNAVELAEAGFKVLLIDCPYNRDQDELPGIIKVKNWMEIKEKIYEFQMELKEITA